MTVVLCAGEQCSETALTTVGTLWWLLRSSLDVGLYSVDVGLYYVFIELYSVDIVIYFVDVGL